MVEHWQITIDVAAGIACLREDYRQVPAPLLERHLNME